MKNLYGKMAFSSSGHEYQSKYELAHHMKIINEYSTGQISREQMVETLEYFERRFRLSNRTNPIFELLVIEDEEERLFRFEIAKNSLLKELQLNYQRAYCDALQMM